MIPYNSNLTQPGNSICIYSYKCLKDAHVIFRSTIKNSHDNGRPKNGMFIAVPLEMKEYVLNVSPNHWRVQAAIIRSVNNNILIINTYFPTDPKVIEFDTTDLLSTLSSIKDVLQRNEYNSVVWTGDINANFCRQSRFTKMIESFIDENEVAIAWSKFQIDCTLTK